MKELTINEKIAELTARITRITEEARHGLFVDGVLWACQCLVIAHSEETLAEFLMQDSCYTFDEFMKAQKKTGYESRKMNKVIRCAFGKEIKG